MRKDQSQYNDAKTSLLANTSGTTGHTHTKKDESRHRLYTLNKSKLKMDHRPDGKCKTMKLLEGTLGKTLSLVMTFKIRISKAPFMRKGSGKLDFLRMKDFCSTKDTIQKMRDKHRLG